MSTEKKVIFRNANSVFTQYVTFFIILAVTLRYLKTDDLNFWAIIIFIFILFIITSRYFSTAYFIYIDGDWLVCEYNFFRIYRKTMNIKDIKNIIIHSYSGRLDQSYIVIPYQNSKNRIYFNGNESDCKAMADNIRRTGIKVEFE